MAAPTITIEPEELLGLTALAELERAGGGEADAASTAKALMHGALAARLTERGLPWAPSPQAARERAAEAAQPGGALRKLTRNDRARRGAASVLAVAALVVLWGGYVRGWAWTGFRANDQLWDWLHLLLLPAVVGTLPLWIQHRGTVSRAKRITCLALLAAFALLVAAGYLIPLSWTGFRGMTLWNWYGLILLPAAVASLGARPSGRPLRRGHKAVIALVGAGWMVTVLGGYLLAWAWTGYAGNTLWDWLQMLLLPLMFPTVLLPAVLRWISGHGRKAPAAAARPGRAPAPDPVPVA
jgi:hypothetical protein